MLKAFLLLIIFVTVLTVPPMPPTEPVARAAYARSRTLGRIIDTQKAAFYPARYEPKYSSMFCWDKAHIKIGKVCPGNCTTGDIYILEDLCKEGMTDLQLQKRCCPVKH